MCSQSLLWLRYYPEIKRTQGCEQCHSIDQGHTPGKGFAFDSMYRCVQFVLGLYLSGSVSSMDLGLVQAGPISRIAGHRRHEAKEIPSDKSLIKTQGEWN